MKNYNRKDHLAQLHKERRHASCQKAEAAILRLVNSGKVVNFNSVSKESGLSKATLYNHLDLRSSIEKLRSQQAQLPTPSSMKREMTEQSKDAVIASLKRKIKVLTEENQMLKSKMNQRYADWYETL